ncbi:MAG: trimethylamine methyltransferase family protein, partial [Anaerolineae bacterium]
MVAKRRERRHRRPPREDREAMVAVARMVQPLLKIPGYNLLDAESLELLHRKSLQILSELGIDFYDAEARAILKAGGATVEGETVRFDPALVEETIARAPSQFTQLARNPENNVVIGGDHL